MTIRDSTKRFDLVALAQVAQASVSTLELWGDRILPADTFDQIRSAPGNAHQ